MAVAIRKLQPEETAQVFPARGQQDVTAYVLALRELNAGDVAAVALQDLSPRTLKRRFSLAAKRLGYRIKWSSRSGEGEVFLRVEQVPVDGSSWGTKRRGRRSKAASG
jgi:hypothetical protein